MQSYKSIVVRASALAAMLGGVLWSAKAFYDMNDAPPWPTDVTDDLFFVVLVFFLAGLSGLYARCRGGLGEWETISSMGFVASLVGLTVSIVGQLTMVLEVGPSWWLGISWWMFVFGFFVMNLTLVFLGNSIVQSGALPRWRAVPLLTGSLGILLILVGDPPNSELGVYPSLVLWMGFGLGWVVQGYVLYSSEDESTKQPALAR
jgi:hypothetical protein